MFNLTTFLQFSKEDTAGCCFFVCVCTQVCICTIGVKAHMHSVALSACERKSECMSEKCVNIYPVYLLFCG